MKRPSTLPNSTHEVADKASLGEIAAELDVETRAAAEEPEEESDDEDDEDEMDTTE